jgi:hypothetical protein
MEHEIKNEKENYSRRMASFLIKLTKTLGVKINYRVEEAILKLKAGADLDEFASAHAGKENLESFFEGEKPSSNKGKKIKYDETLYDL